MTAGPRLDPHFNCAHRSYGLSCADYDDILRGQGGACGVCQGDLPADTFLYVDHDHRLGRWAVRGLVCHYCNTGPLMMTDAGRWPETPRVAQYKAQAWHLVNRAPLTH